MTTPASTSSHYKDLPTREPATKQPRNATFGVDPTKTSRDKQARWVSSNSSSYSQFIPSSGPPPITLPTFAANYSAWWAGDLSGDGNPVASWAPYNDDLTLGNAAQATGAKQPVFRQAESSLGNQPAVEFDGTDDAIVVPEGAALTSPTSLIIIGRLRTLAGYVCDGATTVTNRRLWLISASNWAFNAGSTLSTGIAATTNPTLWLATQLNHTGSSTSTELEINGSAPILGNSGVQLFSGLTLAAALGAGSQFSTLSLNYFALVHGTISTEEKTAVETLASRCGVTIS